MKRFVLASEQEKYSLDALPYDLYIMNKTASAGYYYTTSPLVPATEDAVEVGGKMLYVHWKDEAEAAFDEAASKAMEHHSSVSAGGAGAESLSLFDSFTKFNDEEQLGEMDMWYCNKCKEHRRAYKGMGLWKLPEVLVVHLKRFQYSQGAYFTHREKIEELVHFPIEGLDMAQFTLAPQALPPVYDLYAVSNHSGGLGGGHYTAYAKNFRNGRWYDFNDSYVSPVYDVSSVVSPQAYVLFYRRRDPTGSPALPLAAAAAAPEEKEDEEDEEAAWSRGVDV